MQQSNLVAILNDIRTNGFRKLIIRFSDHDVGSWATWNESEYQKAWNLIAKVHRLVSQQLAGAITSPIYDLGMEMLGAPGTETKAYVQRLWSDYTYTFGSTDTVGFSTIPDAYHLQGLGWYGPTKPAMYAFDVYGNVGAGLLTAWTTLGAEQYKPIIILETYQNDPLTASQIQGTITSHPGMNIVAVTSWPATRQTPTCNGCDTSIALSSIQAIDATTQLSNYKNLASRVVSDNSVGSPLSFTDVNCATTTTSVCTLQINLGYSPSGGQYDYQVYVSGADGVQKLMTCQGQPAHGPVTWIQRDFTYRFQYYRVSRCGGSITGRSPDATSIVFVR